MNNQNKTLKKSRSVRVNRKHDKVGAVVTSVLFALFVVLAVVVQRMTTNRALLLQMTAAIILSLLTLKAERWI